MKPSTSQTIKLVAKNGSLYHKLKRIKQQETFRSNHQIRFESLTKREKEIMTLLVGGSNNPQIAHQLFISRHTVEQHRKNINRKLAIRSFVDIFQFALAFDLI